MLIIYLESIYIEVNLSLEYLFFFAHKLLISQQLFFWEEKYSIRHGKKKPTFSQKDGLQRKVFVNIYRRRITTESGYVSTLKTRNVYMFLESGVLQ